MHQLRPHLTSEQAFIEQVQRQIREGYQLAYIQDGGQVKALAGFRFLEFLAWGKVVYIDDLVSDTATRRNGYGGTVFRMRHFYVLELLTHSYKITSSESFASFLECGSACHLPITFNSC
jgi:hypothetical protein